MQRIANARISLMRIWFMACEVDGTPFHKDFIEASTVPRMGELVEVPITGHEGVDSISDWRVIDVHWRIYEDTTRGNREYEAEIYLVSEAAAAKAEGFRQGGPR
jgi:hypothetical protein